MAIQKDAHTRTYPLKNVCSCVCVYARTLLSTPIYAYTNTDRQRRQTDKTRTHTSTDRQVATPYFLVPTSYFRVAISKLYDCINTSLSVCLSVCMDMSVPLSVCMYVSLSGCLYVGLSILAICLSFCLYILLCGCLSAHLAGWLTECCSVCVSSCLICSSVHPNVSVCPSVTQTFRQDADRQT